MHLKNCVICQSKFKKGIFYTSFIIAIIFVFKAIKIVVYDLTNLAEYGWGYLVGNAGIALLFIGIAYITRRNR